MEWIVLVPTTFDFAGVHQLNSVAKKGYRTVPIVEWEVSQGSKIRLFRDPGCTVNKRRTRSVDR
jgi:hypothetical protein